MAEISFNIADIFEQTFGYKTTAFEPEFLPVAADGSINYSTGKLFSGHTGKYYANDALGREYYMPVTITYDDESGAGNNGTLTSDAGAGGVGILKDWNLPYPIISVSSRKTIVETLLTERRGTVKELINIRDYEIIVKGFIIGSSNEFPEHDVTTLRTIYEQNAALSIKCPLTDIFLLRPGRQGSDQVVIRELSFPAMKGVKNIRPYELRMVSDEPFNLTSITSA